MSESSLPSSRVKYEWKNHTAYSNVKVEIGNCDLSACRQDSQVIEMAGKLETDKIPVNGVSDLKDFIEVSAKRLQLPGGGVLIENNNSSNVLTPSDSIVNSTKYSSQDDAVMNDLLPFDSLPAVPNIETHELACGQVSESLQPVFYSAEEGPKKVVSKEGRKHNKRT